MASHLYELDATEQIARVASGDVSVRDLVEAHCERIRAVNPSLNAITTLLDEAALAAAERANQTNKKGPLHGLLFSVKEDLDCMGTATTRGIVAMRNTLPYADAPIVERLKAAGGIPIARTNLSEAGLRLCTDNPLRGRTFSPYDRALTVGGSSGGDAVAVATGMTPLGVAGDLGGSLRVPAACAGCASLKPTTGRIPHAASLPPRDPALATQLMFSVGPMARSVRDLRLVLEVVAGRDPRDPRSVDVPLRGVLPEEPVAALVTQLPGERLDEASVAMLRRAGRLLEERGISVEEVSPPDLAGVGDLFRQLLALEVRDIARHLQPFISVTLFDYLMRLANHKGRRELSLFRLHAERSRLMREWSGFFSSYAVVVGPTLGGPIWPIDADLHPDRGVAELERATRFLTPGNALGLPCVTLPMGVADGLPTSLLVYADLWREDLCLWAAQAIEDGRGPCGVVDPR